MKIWGTGPPFLELRSYLMFMAALCVIAATALLASDGVRRDLLFVAAVGAVVYSTDYLLGVVVRRVRKRRNPPPGDQPPPQE